MGSDPEYSFRADPDISHGQLFPAMVKSNQGLVSPLIPLTVLSVKSGARLNQIGGSAVP